MWPGAVGLWSQREGFPVTLALGGLRGREWGAGAGEKVAGWGVSGLPADNWKARSERDVPGGRTARS